MEWIDHVILLSSGLIVLSILVGLVSTRFGAPLLLVFLILGMLAGEDGPGGTRRRRSSNGSPTAWRGWRRSPCS